MDFKATKGISNVLFFRLLKNASKNDAKMLAFQTEHEISSSSDSDTTQTKMGPLTTSQGVEEEITATAIMAYNDPTYKMLKQAQRTGDEVEVWDVLKDHIIQAGELDSATYDGKIYAEYRRVIVTEFSKTAAADEYVEVEFTMVTNGTPTEGGVELTEEDLKAITYSFRGLKKFTEQGETE